jgi:hypothetical protein
MKYLEMTPPVRSRSDVAGRYSEASSIQEYAGSAAADGHAHTF